jgi:hypothetical protein
MPWKGAIHHIIPAQAGIHLSSWNKLLYGSPPARGRRRGGFEPRSPCQRKHWGNQVPENASEAFIRDRKKHWPEFVKVPDNAFGVSGMTMAKYSLGLDPLTGQGGG